MYFSKFPKMMYTLDDGKTYQLVTDVTLRAGFINSVAKNTAFYEELDIPEGMTPEVLADKLFGNSLYHWIILLMNEIIDPILDWPMSQRQLIEYATDKYADIYAVHHYEDEFGITVNESGLAYPVSNLEYEDRLNNIKRRIKIPVQEAIPQIIQEFNKIIKQ